MERLSLPRVPGSHGACPQGGIDSERQKMKSVNGPSAFFEFVRMAASERFRDREARNRKKRVLLGLNVEPVNDGRMTSPPVVDHGGIQKVSTQGRHGHLRPCWARSGAGTGPSSSPHRRFAISPSLSLFSRARSGLRMHGLATFQHPDGVFKRRRNCRGSAAGCGKEWVEPCDPHTDVKQARRTRMDHLPIPGHRSVLAATGAWVPKRA